ncbi:NfeD family protein [Cupriavidus sp. AU9028]|uniref:NfeD family protein n=1 Tax=Cupriavidus sp. AU9028 TaxID=2871157 RepID=UPI001C9381F7|nr:NfeD family protein [Cupriavidus sp. AU9028]MBY4897978.1 NfeD family protein [Cupriavidus sp. AU9028]
MANYHLWFGLAVLLVIAELASLTLYLLVVALGALAAGTVAWLGWGLAAQLFVAAAVSLAGFVVLRRSRYGRTRKGAAASDPNVNLDIGQSVEVPAWDAGGRARVSYRGAQWNVELGQGAAALPGRHRIVEVRGNTLIVIPL